MFYKLLLNHNNYLILSIIFILNIYEIKIFIQKYFIDFKKMIYIKLNYLTLENPDKTKIL